MVVDFMVQRGARDLRCPWQDFDRTLEYEERAALEVLYPEDEFWPMADYLLRETTLAEGMKSFSFLFRRGLQGGGELAVTTCVLTSVGPSFDSCLCIPRAIGKGGR